MYKSSLMLASRASKQKRPLKNISIINKQHQIEEQIVEEGEMA